MATAFVAKGQENQKGRIVNKPAVKPSLTNGEITQKDIRFMAVNMSTSVRKYLRDCPE